MWVWSKGFSWQHLLCIILYFLRQGKFLTYLYLSGVFSFVSCCGFMESLLWLKRVFQKPYSHSVYNGVDFFLYACCKWFSVFIYGFFFVYICIWVLSLTCIFTKMDPVRNTYLRQWAWLCSATAYDLRLLRSWAMYISSFLFIIFGQMWCLCGYSFWLYVT